MDASLYFPTEDETSFDNVQHISRSRPNSLKIYGSYVHTPRASKEESSSRKYSSASRYDRALSQEAPDSSSRRRKASIYCEDPPEVLSSSSAREESVSRQASFSRASSVLPDLETQDDDVVDVVTKLPVRNRTSHGVGQYDLERAATWAMIGSNKQEDDVKQHVSGVITPKQSVTETVTTKPSSVSQEIDYKKVE